MQRSKRRLEIRFLRLALGGQSQNVTFKLEDISKRLVKNVPDLLIDLIELPPMSIAPTKQPAEEEGLRPEWGPTGAAAFTSSSR